MFATRLTVRTASLSFVALVLIGLLILPVANVTALDGPTALTWIVNPLTGNEYAAISDCAGWHACEDAAVAENAHLVTVNDGAEQAWLVSQFGGVDHYWIGLSDEAVPNAWVWTSGEPLTYTNWHSGEPSHSGGTEHYVLMNWSNPGEWNDGYSLASTIAIIERPESATPTSTSAPTATGTVTPTATPSSTVPPTITVSPTVTVTPTATGTRVPQPYSVFLVVIYRLDLGYLPGG